jgi:hypothetical protein
MHFHLKYIFAGVCLLGAVTAAAQAPATEVSTPAAPVSDVAQPAVQTPETASSTDSQKAPDQPLPSAPQPQTTEPPRQKTPQEILDEEKKQRMLGIVPIYGMTNYHYAPALTPGQKFDLMARAYITVFPYLAAGFQAGLSQASNSFEGYGQGASGYGKRFGSALADGADSAFFSNFFYPVLFKQDPRYFRLGEGTKKQRIWSAIKQEFVTKKDSDRSATFSYSNVLGALTAGSISNVYYPQEERGFGLTMSRTAVSFGWGMVGNFVLEFWPDVSKGLLHQHKPDNVTIK